jgi:hypothetical protein
VAAANVSFKGITFLPEMAIKWLGGFAAAERAEAPVAAVAAGSGAPGLPGLSAAALLAQQGHGNARGGSENRIVAAARSYGMALFPYYRTGERSGGEVPEPGADTHERVSSSSDASRVASVNVLNNLNIPRAADKKDKRRKGNKDNLAADALSNLTRKPDAAEETKPDSPEEPESGPS